VYTKTSQFIFKEDVERKPKNLLSGNHSPHGDVTYHYNWHCTE